MGRTIFRPTPHAGYDDGVYQADTREIHPPRFTSNDLPAYCCRIAGVGRPQPCRRTLAVDTLHSVLEEITLERARHRRTRNDWRARCLVGFVAMLERKLAFLLTAIKVPACTGNENRLAEPTRDRSLVLPGCSC